MILLPTAPQTEDPEGLGPVGRAGRGESHKSQWVVSDGYIRSGNSWTARRSWPQGRGREREYRLHFTGGVEGEIGNNLEG